MAPLQRQFVSTGLVLAKIAHVQIKFQSRRVIPSVRLNVLEAKKKKNSPPKGAKTAPEWYQRIGLSERNQTTTKTQSTAPRHRTVATPHGHYVQQAPSSKRRKTTKSDPLGGNKLSGACRTTTPAYAASKILRPSLRFSLRTPPSCSSRLPYTRFSCLSAFLFFLLRGGQDPARRTLPVPETL